MNKVKLLGVVVPYHLTEKTRRFLREHNLINTDFNFKHEQKHIIIPVNVSNKKLLERKLREFSKFDQIKIRETDFEQKEKRITNLYEYLKVHIPYDLHKFIPKSFDIIGNIVIIEIKEEIQRYKELIGQALISIFPSISTVYKKSSAVSGEYRIRQLEFIAGERKCETTHIEHGIRIFVDVCRAYFSPRLGNEHTRIASLCKDGETIVDFFTGVGPFPLHIAKNKKAKIFAIDVNPIAIKCLKKSMKMNKLIGEIIPICGDIKAISKDIPKANRVIMNLPESSHKFIKELCDIAKIGTIVHFYHFVKETNAKEHITQLLQDKLEKYGWKIKRVIKFQKIRESSPHELHARLDAEITTI